MQHCHLDFELCSTWGFILQQLRWQSTIRGHLKFWIWFGGWMLTQLRSYLPVVGLSWGYWWRCHWRSTAVCKLPGFDSVFGACRVGCFVWGCLLHLVLFSVLLRKTKFRNWSHLMIAWLHCVSFTFFNSTICYLIDFMMLRQKFVLAAIWSNFDCTAGFAQNCPGLIHTYFNLKWFVLAWLLRGHHKKLLTLRSLFFFVVVFFASSSLF